MRVAPVGGTGHVGTYLVPRPVAAGHDVSVVSRGERDPYHDDAAWEAVETVELDRKTAEERGESSTCSTAGRCGSTARASPSPPEDEPRRPFGDSGTEKAEIES